MLTPNTWTKSTFSSGGDNCVETRHTGHGVQVRHSKARNVATLDFTPDEWNAFVDGVKAGEFDLA